MTKGTLFLIPVPLGENIPASHVLPLHVIETARHLRFYIAENPKTCRAFLKSIEIPVPLQEVQVESYGKHDRKEISPSAFLKPLLEGHDVGLVSEAGCPAIADPGAEVVRAAHDKGIKVVPLTGPSSLLLSLMASGFNGQQFRFHGYLPIDAKEREEWIRDMEHDANKYHITQVFIETPFRNMQLFEALMKSLRAETLLCIASDLTTSQENVQTKTVREWKKEKAPELHKVPVVFLIGR